MDRAGTGSAQEPDRPPDDRLRVRNRRHGDVEVLALAGELDHDTADPLRQELSRAVGARPARVVVDCASLGFCDSTGLNVLLHARLEAREAGIRIEVSGLRPPVARMFGITGADSVFRLHAGLDEALADETTA
ncbi:STAS domain-containing protein [Streptomyces sp. NPDC005805]|uniref:STAS domain-containing protein n=1 Tax=Streptomyces sp. NPDC005805 TaxID=3157068 RepID=UPI0033FCEDB5